ncbi:MAG TPA: helix-hairpin-helix domain-containing protein [Bacteroidales bacterium]|jgi:DNA uptake protein ComE-like DNA-binding protein|nr:helix-hairpin-helix domain-containing protein [Bacteroidales bacterium]
MKNKFIDSLSLTSGERKGVIVLVLIIFIIAGIQAFLAFHNSPVPSFDDSTFFSRIIADDPSENDSIGFAVYEVQDIRDTFGLFIFDPNTVSAGDLMRLGLNTRLIRTWLNYRTHGGRFYSASDVRKIYGMTPYIYERIRPYITIRTVTGGIVRPKNNARITEKAGINTCDSTDLLRVIGIGPVLSGRIIKYRRLLGGFYDMQQLSEVYGINDSLVKVISLSFYADTINLHSININEASEETLRRHPYLGRYISGGIIKYRTNVQIINDLEELKDNGILTGEQFEKVKKYLDI